MLTVLFLKGMPTVWLRGLEYLESPTIILILVDLTRAL